MRNVCSARLLSCSVRSVCRHSVLTVIPFLHLVITCFSATRPHSRRGMGTTKATTRRGQREKRTRSKPSGHNGKAQQLPMDFYKAAPGSDEEIRSTILELIGHLKAESTICPSQVPRKLHDMSPKKYPDWRQMMPHVRQVVWDLVKDGQAEVTQRGEVRSWDMRNNLKGPLRVRRGPKYMPESSIDTKTWLS